MYDYIASLQTDYTEYWKNKPKKCNNWWCPEWSKWNRLSRSKRIGNSTQNRWSPNQNNSLNYSDKLYRLIEAMVEKITRIFNWNK